VLAVAGSSPRADSIQALVLVRTMKLEVVSVPDLPLELLALVRALDAAPPSSALVDDAPSKWGSPQDYAGSPPDGDALPTIAPAPG
jgi:hypothetical protein